jgi:hypothetical protein
VLCCEAGHGTEQSDILLVQAATTISECSSFCPLWYRDYATRWMTEEVGLYSLLLTLPTDCGALWGPSDSVGSGDRTAEAKVRVSTASPCAFIEWYVSTR